MECMICYFLGDNYSFRRHLTYKFPVFNQRFQKTIEVHSKMNNKLILLYLLILLGHVDHIIEEVWGRFWLMGAVYGLGWFLVANWILLCLPVIFFYFVLLQKRWAYYLSMVYAGVMILNGLGHNVATLITGQYADDSCKDNTT